MVKAGNGNGKMGGRDLLASRMGISRADNHCKRKRRNCTALETPNMSIRKAEQSPTHRVYATNIYTQFSLSTTVDRGCVSVTHTHTQLLPRHRTVHAGFFLAPKPHTQITSAIRSHLSSPTIQAPRRVRSFFEKQKSPSLQQQQDVQKVQKTLRTPSARGLSAWYTLVLDCSCSRGECVVKSRRACLLGWTHLAGGLVRGWLSQASVSKIPRLS